jgi:hypothetical protein
MAMLICGKSGSRANEWGFIKAAKMVKAAIF